MIEAGEPVTSTFESARWTDQTILSILEEADEAPDDFLINAIDIGTSQDQQSLRGRSMLFQKFNLVCITLPTLYYSAVIRMFIGNECYVPVVVRGDGSPVGPGGLQMSSVSPESSRELIKDAWRE